MARSPKAVCLISGGLDSALAALLLKEQGIEVLGLHVILPFEEIFKQGNNFPAIRVARAIGIDLRIVVAGEDYVDILRSPKYGFGSQRNPCIDCHIYMLKRAREVMVAEQADLVATGEVLGQRPMSQRRDALAIVERDSGLKGYLLRPLSALLLSPTQAEQAGIVDRQMLLAIKGRSRKELLSLAEQKGLGGLSKPAGGCLLTDPQITPRIDDLLYHGILSYKELRRIGVGRHLRIAEDAKLIVGRNHSENLLIGKLASDGEALLEPFDVPGPVGLLSGNVDKHLELAASVVARYSDANNSANVRIEVKLVGLGQSQTLTVSPLAAEETKPYLL